MIRIMFFIFFIQYIVCECVKDNDVEEESWENYLGSKTPYRIVANNSFTKIQYNGCEPLKIWALIRHGTRNPNVALIDKMNVRLPIIRDQILINLNQSNEFIHKSDLENFKRWKSKLNENDEKTLTTEGEQEMLLLGERIQSRFPTILNNIYSETNYKFKYTATQRTKKSALYFTVGLFGRSTARQVEYPEPLKRDPILRFYKLCNKWRNEISKNPKALIEIFKFVNSKIMNNTLKEINERLNFINNQLNFDDIYSMYLTCAFETAWNRKRKSPWCSPFSISNFKVFEYYEDLKHYWKDGYGYELTYKQACPAFGDMLNHFKSNETYPKATIYFTHSGTLLKMLAHLDLYKTNEHLTTDNFYKNNQRKWRVSKIDSFGTNIVMVLFNCEGKRKVLTMHQEKIIHLPSCPNMDLCDLDKLENYYKESINNCAFNKMCDNEK